MRREGVESEEEFFLSTGWGLSFLCENNAFVSISDICVVLSVCGGVWCMPPYELCFFSLLRVGANAPLPLPAGAHDDSKPTSCIFILQAICLIDYVNYFFANISILCYLEVCITVCILRGSDMERRCERLATLDIRVSNCPFFSFEIFLFCYTRNFSTAFTSCTVQLSIHFWPTVLSVVPLVQCVVCRLSVCLSSVCRL